jgi:hypothetical protein
VGSITEKAYYLSLAFPFTTSLPFYRLMHVFLNRKLDQSHYKVYLQKKKLLESSDVLIFMLYNLYNVGQIKDLGSDVCKPLNRDRGSNKPS